MKVIKTFMDKVTHKYYRLDSEYKGDRVDELQSKGLLESPKKEVKKSTSANKDGKKKGDK